MSRDGERIAGLWIVGSASLGGFALLMWGIGDRPYAPWVAAVGGVGVLAFKWYVISATEEWIRTDGGEEGEG